MRDQKIWAIIPARSGSKGLPNKNILELAGIPLLGHTIKFANKTGLFDKVLVSTDSEVYKSIAIKYGGWVPFLRSSSASQDNSMEEDILKDIDLKLSKKKIPKPDVIVWLRPTFPFRSKIDLINALEQFLKSSSKVDSMRLIIPADPRLYFVNKGYLESYSFKSKYSMVRRQNFPETYNVFHTDIFWYKNISLGKRFLGKKIDHFIIHKICGIDIDLLEDFELAEALLKTQTHFIQNYSSLK